MMRATTIVALCDGLRETDLLTWVERGWVRPDDGLSFQDADVARVRLIHELLFRMDMREDAIPLILSLLDQVYDLRGALHAVLGAIRDQPAPVRGAVTLRGAILAGLRL